MKRAILLVIVVAVFVTGYFVGLNRNAAQVIEARDSCMSPHASVP